MYDYNVIKPIDDYCDSLRHFFLQTDKDIRIISGLVFPKGEMYCIKVVLRGRHLTLKFEPKHFNIRKKANILYEISAFVRKEVIFK